MEYVKTFVLSGSIMAIVQYVANEIDPALASISFPFTLPALFLVNRVVKSKKYIWNSALMLTVLVIITYLTWFLYAKLRLSKIISVGISLILWMISVVIYYYSNIQNS